MKDATQSISCSMLVFGERCIPLLLCFLGCMWMCDVWHTIRRYWLILENFNIIVSLVRKLADYVAFPSIYVIGQISEIPRIQNSKRIFFLINQLYYHTTAIIWNFQILCLVCKNKAYVVFNICSIKGLNLSSTSFLSSMNAFFWHLHSVLQTHVSNLCLPGNFDFGNRITLLEWNNFILINIMLILCFFLQFYVLKLQKW